MPQPFVPRGLRYGSRRMRHDPNRIAQHTALGKRVQDRVRLEIQLRYVSLRRGHVGQIADDAGYARNVLRLLAALSEYDYLPVIVVFWVRETEYAETAVVRRQEPGVVAQRMTRNDVDEDAVGSQSPGGMVQEQAFQAPAAVPVFVFGPVVRRVQPQVVAGPGRMRTLSMSVFQTRVSWRRAVCDLSSCSSTP